MATDPMATDPFPDGFENWPERDEYLPDPEREWEALERIADLVGPIDPSSAGVALDFAEEAGLDTSAARASVEAVATIHAILVRLGLLPLWEDRPGE